MNKVTDEIENKSYELYEKLKTERDELKLKTHLMKTEIGDKWEATEQQWSRFKSKFNTIKKGTGEAVSDLGSGFSNLGHDIKEAYQEIKKGIKSSQLTK